MLKLSADIFRFSLSLCLFSLFCTSLNRNAQKRVDYSQLDIDETSDVSPCPFPFFPSFLPSRRMLFMTEERRAFRMCSSFYFLVGVTCSVEILFVHAYTMIHVETRRQVIHSM